MYVQAFRASTVAAALYGAFVLPALALPTTLGASTSATGNGASTSDTPPTSTTTTVTSFSAVSDPLGNGSAFSFSSPSGSYAVSSFAEGKDSAGAAYASFLYLFENTSGVAQHLTLNFYIYGGQISTTALAPLTSGESLGSSYAASIKADGVTKFSSSASISQTDSGISHGKGGTDLNAGDDGSDGYYSWGGSYHSIDLGIVAAGATVEVLAEVQNAADSDVGTYDFGDSCFGGYEQLSNHGYDGYECFKGRAEAFYGDPLGLDPQAPIFRTDPVGLPEPASVGLVALALGWLARARRRFT